MPQMSDKMKTLPGGKYTVKPSLKEFTQIAVQQMQAQNQKSPQKDTRYSEQESIDPQAPQILRLLGIEYKISVYCA